MAKLYGILVCEDSRDLISLLTDGAPYQAEDDKHVFLLSLTSDAENTVVPVEAFYAAWPEVESIGNDLIALKV